MDLINYLREILLELFSSFISSLEFAQFLTTLSMVFIWILIGYLTLKITRLFMNRTRFFKYKETKEGLTIRRLVTNLIRALFVFWILVMVLAEIGINIVPLLAGAGVLAFAVGFGAQELFTDLISGFFLILEKTFKIGDTVEIGGNDGIVEEIGLRRTKIRSFTGDAVTVNNGDIKKVINKTVYPGVARIEFNIDFRKDIKLFTSDNFNKFIKEFANSQENVIDEGSPMIITDIASGKVTMRVSFTTEVGKRVGVERDFRRELLIYARNNNIDLEVPVVLEHDNIRPSSLE